MADVKWSSFANQGVPAAGDKIVGLHAGTNVQFTAGSLAAQNANALAVTGGSATLHALSAPFTYAAVTASIDLAVQDALTAFEFTINAGSDIADALGLVNYTNGFTFSLKNTTSGDCTFTPFSGELIDGASSLTIPAQGGYIVQKNPDQWSIIANKAAGGGVTSTQVQKSAFNVGLDSGIVDAYVVTLSPVVTELTDGLQVVFAAQNSNVGGSPTLDVGTGAFTIVKQSGNTLAANDMLSGYDSICVWSVANTSWQLLNPQTTAGGASLWFAGAGTDSIIGGDGSETAAGNYSLVYGTDSAACDANYSVVLGQGNTMGAGSYNSFLMGRFSSLGLACEYSFVFGPGCSTANSCPNSIIMGNGSGTTQPLNIILGGGIYSTHYGCITMTDGYGGAQSPTANFQFTVAANGGYYFYGGFANGVLGVSFDAAQNLVNHKGTADQSYSYQTPTTGFSIAIAAGVRTLTLAPAGALAAGTIDLGSVAPVDGQLVRVNTTQTIVALSFIGATVNNAPTTLPAGQGFDLQYNLANTAWNPIYQALNIGLMESLVPVASAITLANATAADIATLTLTLPGIWEVTGNVMNLNTVAQSYVVLSWINTVSATQPDFSLVAGIDGSSSVMQYYGCEVPKQRITVAAGSPVTVYLSSFMEALSGTLTACGNLYATLINPM